MRICDDVNDNGIWRLTFPFLRKPCEEFYDPNAEQTRRIATS